MIQFILFRFVIMDTIKTFSYSLNSFQFIRIPFLAGNDNALAC